MFERPRRALGLQLTRFRLRHTTETVISFTNSFTSAERVLVILPFGLDPALPGAPVFEMLSRRFSDVNITLVADEARTSLARFMPRSALVRVAPVDLTSLFLPRRELLTRITQRPYDVAIDLNLDLVLPSAYICRESNARVRVGVARDRADLFYNFQIQPNALLGRQRLYERLVTCLQMF
jgi:ADP-heptose:LPS heptosyltransferase